MAPATTRRVRVVDAGANEGAERWPRVWPLVGRGAQLQVLAARCDGAGTPALRLHVGAPTLTSREKEVAALVAGGLTSKAIAEHLVLSPRTVESHLYRIFTKLGVSDRAELAALLTSPPPG